jgi:hypothetical protein
MFLEVSLTSSAPSGNIWSYTLYSTRPFSKSTSHSCYYPPNELTFIATLWLDLDELDQEIKKNGQQERQAADEGKGTFETD